MPQRRKKIFFQTCEREGESAEKREIRCGKKRKTPGRGRNEIEGQKDRDLMWGGGGGGGGLPFT